MFVSGKLATTTRRLSALLAASFLFSLLLPSALAQVDELHWKLKPVDESDRDPGFAAFLKGFRKFVELRDREALLAVISPDIKNGFGGEDGYDQFVEIWNFETEDSAQTSAVWDVLANLLKLGGKWGGPPGNDSQYCIPYLYSAFPVELDPFTYSVVTGDSVRMRRNPSRGSATKGSLSWDIVTVMAVNGDWTQVRTHNGKIGFVSSEYVHGPVDYRACFTHSANGWKMSMLLSGD